MATRYRTAGVPVENSSCVYPSATRCAGFFTGRAIVSRLRVTASCMACWITGVGAPSPIWQHGAVTEIRTVALTLPSLTADTLAVPAPTARAVALALPAEESSTITRLLVLIHVTVRSVRLTPDAVKRFA